MAVTDHKYNLSVFVNCPIDRRYGPLLKAATFAIFDCGYIARSALEITNTGVVRISKIKRIISECRFGLHDLSRTSLNKAGLPRFNMPLELGLFLGASEFGDRRQRTKICLVLDRDRFRYQKFISDIAGQDIAAHQNDQERVVAVVRDWLNSSQKKVVPGPAHIWNRFQTFQKGLPRYCRDQHLKPSELTFSDYATFVSEWIVDRSNFLKKPEI